eukprot:g4007.t1
MVPSSKLIAAFVTVPSKKVGLDLAHSLVKKKLAACVNIKSQVTSVYEWKGNVEEDEEFLLMIKTRKSLLKNLTAQVIKEHPYDVPEVIAMDITGGSQDYMDFVLENTKNETVE